MGRFDEYKLTFVKLHVFNTNFLTNSEVTSSGTSIILV